MSSDFLIKLQQAQTLFALALIAWTFICGLGLYVIEHKLADSNKQLQPQPKLLVARRLGFVLVSTGLGVLAYQLFGGLIVFSLLSSSSDTRASINLVAWVILILFSIPTIISFLAIFFKQLSRTAYLTFSIYIFPAFLGLLGLSIYRRLKHSSTTGFFPANATIILVSWGTFLLLIVIQLMLLIFLFPTRQEMEAENQQQLNEAIAYVHKQEENEQLLEDSIEEFELTYTEDWQQSVDHRKITVQIGAQGKSTVTLEKSGSVTLHESFDYPVDALANLIELLADDSFQTLQDQYCHSPGQCLNDSAVYTLSVTLAREDNIGEEKTVIWGQGDPQAQATVLNTIGVTILRPVPVNIYD